MNAVAVERRTAPAGSRVARPRVTMVVASLDIIGGHGVQATTLVGHMREEGYSVSLLPIDPAFPRPLLWMKRVPYARTLLTQALYRPSLRRLAECDVVHVFAASYWSFLLGPVPAIQAARRLGKRIVLNYHSGEADDHLARWGRLVHPFLRMADAIVVPSRYLSRVFTRRGHVCRVIPNVVDTTAFRHRERVPLRPRLLSTRNLEPIYDIATTIEAFARVHRAVPSATLTVVGRGSQDEPLRRLAASLGVDGAVRFAGRVEPALMPALCDEHDIFLNASLVDNQPLSVLEAMAAGLPIVSTPTGAIAEMLGDGAAGCLVPPRDAAAMASAVLALLADPDRAAAMARGARKAVDAYTWPEVRDRWVAAYGGGA